MLTLTAVSESIGSGISPMSISLAEGVKSLG
jgi:hypothetical protein